MADIKRYQPDVVYARYGGGRDHVLHEHTNGDYVLYSDHLAALEAAVATERERIALYLDEVMGKPFGDDIRARGAAHD